MTLKNFFDSTNIKKKIENKKTGKSKINSKISTKIILKIIFTIILITIFIISVRLIYVYNRPDIGVLGCSLSGAALLILHIGAVNDTDFIDYS